MRDFSSGPGLRQVLWVAAGVVVATLLIVAASWLFSPRPTSVTPGLTTKPLDEGEVKKETFRTETPGPVGEVKPGAGPEDLPTVTTTPSNRLGSEAAARPVIVAPPPSIEPPATPAPKPLKTEPKAPATGPGLPPAPPRTAEAKKSAFGIQVGAFSSEANAKEAKKKLESQGFRVALIPSGDKTKVVVKGFTDKPAADRALASVRKTGFDGAFIVPME